jgi:hypothetical protein
MALAPSVGCRPHSRLSVKNAQKRPHAPPNSTGISRAQVNECQTDNETTISHTRLAIFNKRSQSGLRFCKSSCAKGRMHQIAGKDSVRRIELCRFTPEIRVIRVTMGHSCEPALGMETTPSIKPGERMDEFRRYSTTNGPARDSTQSAKQKNRRSEPAVTVTGRFRHQIRDSLAQVLLPP